MRHWPTITGIPYSSPGLVLLVVAVCIVAGLSACTGQRVPQQITLEFVGNFRGFQRPCG